MSFPRGNQELPGGKCMSKALLYIDDFPRWQRQLLKAIRAVATLEYTSRENSDNHVCTILMFNILLS